MSSLSDFVGGAPAKWVTGTVYSPGKVVWSPTDYQYYMRKTAGAGAIDPAGDTANWQPTGARAVKSIQRGVISSTSATATATISSVNLAKTELRFLGASSAPGASVEGLFSLLLTNSTTITATKASAGFSSNVSWELTERY